MLIAAVVLFALAAIGGIILAGLHLRARPVSMAVVVLHGLLAAAGLVVLIVAIATLQLPALAVAALVLFLIAALGGFLLLAWHLRKQPLKRPLIFGHGLLAVIGFVLLLITLASHA